MSKDISYTDNTTTLPGNNLNDIQEQATGAIWGARLDLQTSNTQVRLTGDTLTESQFSIRVGLKPRYSTTPISVTGSGSVGTRDIFVTSATGDTPKAPGVEVDVTGSHPSTAYYRKIGEATWSGTAYTNLRLTNGVQANADQFNNFVFTPLIASSTPLTVRGLASQSADIFRVEDSTQTAAFRVTASGAVTTTQTATLALLGAGTVGAPALSFTGDSNTGLYNSNSDELSVAAGGVQMVFINGNGMTMPTSSISAPLVFNTDVSLYRSAANTLALNTGSSLNIISGNLLFGGVQIASSNLSDNANIAKLSSSLFSGVTGFTAGTNTSPGIYISGDTNTGIYSSGADSLSITTGGTARLTANSAGLLTIPTAGVSAGLAFANGSQLFSGSGGTYTGIANLAVLAQSLEIRKSSGASSLVLSRPDGTRIAISLDNSNTIQFAVAP